MAKKQKQKQTGGGQAIDGKRITIFDVPVTDLLVYPEWHPRFDVRSTYPADPAMVANVRLRGVRKPIDVEVVKGVQRLDGGTLSPGLYVVDGHQRRAWALAARSQLIAEGEPGAEIRVPVRQIKGDDAYLSSMSVALNRHVEDDPIIGAQRIRSVLDRLGGDLEATAAAVGRPAGYVRSAIRLLDLAAPVQRAVAGGQISVAGALELGKLSKADQAAGLEAAIAGAGEGDGRRGGKATTARAVREAVHGDKPRAPTRREIQARLDELAARGRVSDMPVIKILSWVLTGSIEGTP